MKNGVWENGCMRNGVWENRYYSGCLRQHENIMRLCFYSDEELNKAKGKAFDSTSTDGVKFSFFHKLPS